MFIKNLLFFFLMGIIWLFIFSIPVGHGKRIYHLGFYYLVDTRLVHLITDLAFKSAEKTNDAIQEVIEK